MKDITFEKAIEELETIVKKLEEGKISLDESLALFEKGMELGRFCAEKLQKIERKIELLVKEGGSIKAMPFDEEQ